MSMTGRSWTITAGEHEATVAEVAAALRGYRYRGVQVTCCYGTDTLPPKGCGITLVPWPNRIRGGRYAFDGVTQQLALTEPALGNAIHGLGRWVRWAPVEHSADRVTLRLDVVPQNGYPHQVRVEVCYALDAATGLTVTTTASNTGRTRAPFGAGAHPYLATYGHRLDEVTVRLPAETLLLTDETSIPVDRRSVDGTPHDLRGGAALGGRRFDAGFADLTRDSDGRAVAEVRTPSGGARLWLGPEYRYAQLFTVERLTASGAGIAVEPMSCPADAFNSGEALVVLDPGDSWSGGWGITPQ